MTEIKAVASGSAALQPRLARFFNGIGVPILEGYGLTETSPVISVNTTAQPGMLRIGAVGKVIDGVEVKIAEDGEILAKGPNIMMGYYKQPELTAEVMTGEWFHTGDIGVIEDGFIRKTITAWCFVVVATLIGVRLPWVWVARAQRSHPCGAGSMSS